MSRVQSVVRSSAAEQLGAEVRKRAEEMRDGEKATDAASAMACIFLAEAGPVASEAGKFAGSVHVHSMFSVFPRQRKGHFQTAPRPDQIGMRTGLKWYYIGALHGHTGSHTYTVRFIQLRSV